MEDHKELSGMGEQADLLSEESLTQFVYATTGQRFLNWLIDNLFMQYGLSYVTGMLMGVIVVSIAPEFFQSSTPGEISAPILILAFLVAYLNYIIYYTICEKLFKGYTLGKVITGTRAIRQDGNELTFKDALLRSLSRLVPFEIFSGFSTLTWHDSWTDTMVIKSR